MKCHYACKRPPSSEAELRDRITERMRVRQSIADLGVSRALRAYARAVYRGYAVSYDLVRRAVVDRLSNLAAVEAQWPCDCARDRHAARHTKAKEQRK